MLATNALHATQVGASAPESSPAVPYQFRLGLSLVHGLARPISIIVSSDPDDGIKRESWHHVLAYGSATASSRASSAGFDSRLPSSLQTTRTWL